MPAVPYLRIQGASRAIDFYTAAFGAKEVMRLIEPGTGRVGHAEILIDGSLIMLADEFPEYGIRGPASLGGTTISITLNVDDVDAWAERAERAGATVTAPPKDEFYGDRSCRITDPFGHEWNVSTTLETLSADEMQRRYNALFDEG